MFHRQKIIGAFFIAALLWNGATQAQVPVNDAANLAKSTEIANTTNDILTASRDIMQNTQRTLQAVTGDRTGQAGQLASMALGGGFSMGQAPSLGSLLSGGPLSFQGMGSSQGMVSQLINGLQLVQSLSGLINGQRTGNDQGYRNSVNLAATMAGMVSSTQGAIQTRSQAFTTGGQQIGSAPDLKGSVDQNTQVQIQTGQTINELTGVVNNAVAATNQQNLERLQLLSSTARAMSITPGR
ncbi:MAG: type IV secretion system protein [Bosea sp. (in: a-proteobacteria)]